MKEHPRQPPPYADTNDPTGTARIIPPQSQGSVTSLPRFLTTFIGRESAIESVTLLLSRDDVRMVTLTGPGGSGKTRLAVEVVKRLPPGAWDDTWFIPLAAVHHPALVIPDIAQTIGVPQVSGRPVVETLIRFLRGRHALLVIDNFEMVVAAGPELARILGECPGITMLVTSRFALQVSGEHIVVVPPLELPGTTPISLDTVRSFESVRLFEERARASSTTFALTDEHAPVIVEICRRLDGLPLAIELAAARCGMLSPAALLRLLTRQPGILAGGPQDAPERHRSMRNAIAWSYDLLPSHEQTVFRRLAAFSGGFTLEAADAVVGLPGDLLETFASLTAKSLIVPVTSDDGEPRFTMLETLREYGLERLDEAGEMAATRDRHAAFYLDEAIQGEYAWCMYLPDGLYWLSRLVADHANFRQALEWLYEFGDIASCLRMAGALTSLWILRGHLKEGQVWLERLLAEQHVVDDAVRANGIATLGWISNQQDRMEKSFTLAEEAILLSRDGAIPLDAIRARVLSGIAAGTLRQYALAKQRLEDALRRMMALDEPDWLGNFVQNTLVTLGSIELENGAIDAAEERYQQAWDTDLARGYEPGTSFIYGNAVIAARGRVARARGDAALALGYLQQHLHLTHRHDNMSFLIHAICHIAGALSQLGQPVQAARLFGASEALMELYGYDFIKAFNLERATGLPEPWAREAEPCEPYDVLRDALRPRTVTSLPSAITIDMLERAWTTGRTLSLEAAVAEALAATAEQEEAVIPGTGHGYGHDLTPRQMEVLGLLVDGLSNRAIAETLSLSERTVEHHIMHILDRLGVDSRTAAATFAVREGLV